MILLLSLKDDTSMDPEQIPHSASVHAALQHNEPNYPKLSLTKLFKVEKTVILGNIAESSRVVLQNNEPN